MKHIHFFYTALCVAALLGGCKGKDGDPGPAGAVGSAGPAGPSGQNLSGSIVGFVNPMTEDGVTLSKGGVLVTITSVMPQLTQTTDANGRYEFANLPAGTYNLSYNRSDLGLYKIFGYGHVGGSQPSFLNETYLTALSTTYLSNLVVTSPSFNSFRPEANFSAYATSASSSFNPSNYNYFQVVVYASNTPGVSSTASKLLGTFYTYSSSSSQLSSFTVSRAEFVAAGFTPGTRVYAVVYGAPSYNSRYIDVVTGRTIFPGINTNGSQEVSFTAP